MLLGMTPILLCGLGWVSLAFGIVGIFLPLWPTTPFVLLAAYFFARGSKRLHAWLCRNPVFGKMISDWESAGMINLRAKLVSTAMIVGLFGYTLICVPVVVWIKVCVGLIGLSCLTFIWTRPSHR